MNRFQEDIADFLVRETPLSPEEAARIIETPPDPRHGDYAVPCYRLAKVLKRSPQDIAKDLAESFIPTRRILAAEIAGPYLNIRLNRALFLAETLEKPAAGSEDGAGKTIVLDYCSPNISKHLAYHHIRTTVIGYSLKRIFDHLGYRTVGINHLGDWGTTHGCLIAAWKRWGGELDLDSVGVTELNDLYVRFNAEGDDAEGREWFRKLEGGDREARRLWERFREVSISEHQEVFDLLGVTFDEVRAESDFAGDLSETIRKVEEAGITTVSDGALVVEFPEEGTPPFFLRKADGATVYATRDLAAGFERWEKYRFERCIYVVDLGQSLHFSQFFRVLSMMGLPWAGRMEHVGFGVIRFGGRKTGTRTGNVVLLRDVLVEAIDRIRALIEEKNPDLHAKDDVARAVGVGATIFASLASRRLKDVDFNWDDMLNFEGHTGPYVQYTHARCASIARKSDGLVEEPDLDLLTLPEEWEVGKLLALFPDRVRAAAKEAEPSLVAQYLLSLSEAFSRYYNLGNQDPAKKVLTRDPSLAAARLHLVDGVRRVLARGLWLLGIEAPEAM